MSTTQSAYDEMLSFMRSGPKLEQIIHYQHSSDTLARIAYLKRAAKGGTISREEMHELREFKRIEHFMQLLRIRAMRRLGWLS